MLACRTLLTSEKLWWTVDRKRKTEELGEMPRSNDPERQENYKAQYHFAVPRIRTGYLPLWGAENNIYTEGGRNCTTVRRLIICSDYQILGLLA